MRVSLYKCVLTLTFTRSTTCITKSITTIPIGTHYCI